MDIGTEKPAIIVEDPFRTKREREVETEPPVEVETPERELVPAGA